MAGFNTGVVTRKMFEYIDPRVITPARGARLGRTLFQIDDKPQTWDDTYKYYWKERMGQASDVVDRATDLTTVDVTYHEELGFITQKGSALEYSDEEIARAQQGDLDILGDKTQAVNDALADWEDRLIFNGNDDSQKPIYGLTSDPAKAGFQVADDAPVTFDKIVDPSNTDPYNDANKLINWFIDAGNKIKFLPGKSNAQLVLALPQKEYSLLIRPYNKYSTSDTILSMVQDTKHNGANAVFSKIVPVPELSAEFWNTQKGTAGKKDCGMIFINDPDTADIKVAMNPARFGRVEYTDGKTKIKYMERTGGLCIKFPAGFVRLNGIN